jgi:hypothetical protein
MSTDVSHGLSWRCCRVFSGIEDSLRMTDHGEGLTEHAPSPRTRTFFSGKRHPRQTTAPKKEPELIVSHSCDEISVNTPGQGPRSTAAIVAQIDLAEGTSGLRLRDGQGT